MRRVTRDNRHYRLIGDWGVYRQGLEVYFGDVTVNGFEYRGYIGSTRASLNEGDIIGGDTMVVLPDDIVERSGLFEEITPERGTQTTGEIVPPEAELPNAVNDFITELPTAEPNNVTTMADRVRRAELNVIRARVGRLSPPLDTPIAPPISPSVRRLIAHNSSGRLNGEFRSPAERNAILSAGHLCDEMCMLKCPQSRKGKVIPIEIMSAGNAAVRHNRGRINARENRSSIREINRARADAGQSPIPIGRPLIDIGASLRWGSDMGVGTSLPQGTPATATPRISNIDVGAAVHDAVEQLQGLENNGIFIDEASNVPNSNPEPNNET